MPYLSFGALLVLVCVLGYAYYASRLGERVPVLAVSAQVAAGQSITAADLRQVSAANDASLGFIPVSQASDVVGRLAVVPLLPGTLLTRSLLGDAAFPPAGKVVASLALKPGHFPQGLVAGAHVAVFVSAGNAGGQSSSGPSTPGGGVGSRLSAVVLGVDPGGDGQGNTVVTLLLDSSDAMALAGGSGVVLMQTAAAGG